MNLQQQAALKQAQEILGKNFSTHAIIVQTESQGASRWSGNLSVAAILHRILGIHIDQALNSPSKPEADASG